MKGLERLRLLAAGLDHPEGVSVGPDGMLWAGGEAGQVYRIDPADGSVEQVASTGGAVLGLCLDATGAVYVCDFGRLAVLRIDPASGAVERWCESIMGEPWVYPNWAAFAADGSLYVSDSGREQLDACEGRIVRIPPGGGEGEALDLPPLHFANGLAVEPDGNLVVLESLDPRLSRVDLATGELTELAVFPGTNPDGVACLADGGHVVSMYYPNHLWVVPAGGAPKLLLDDSVGIHAPTPTNIAFYGPDLRTLALASLGGTWLSSLATDLVGAPLHYPPAVRMSR